MWTRSLHRVKGTYCDFLLFCCEEDWVVSLHHESKKVRLSSRGAKQISGKKHIREIMPPESFGKLPLLIHDGKNSACDEFSWIKSWKIIWVKKHFKAELKSISGLLQVGKLQVGAHTGTHMQGQCVSSWCIFLSDSTSKPEWDHLLIFSYRERGVEGQWEVWILFYFFEMLKNFKFFIDV